MSRTKATEVQLGIVERSSEAKECLIVGGRNRRGSGSLQEHPHVMAAQSDLVETVGQFMPKIVMVCGGCSRPED